MEVIKCKTMETIGEARNLKTKSKMAESWFASSQKRVFETQTATGREQFSCYYRIVSEIFILLTSNGERYLVL